MIEFDELGEIAWLPFLLLAILIAWRWRPALLAGFAGGGWLPTRRDGHANAPGNRIMLQAGSVLTWMRGRQWNSRLTSGNQSFDAYRNEALRKLAEEQREFQGFLERLHQARDQSEFDAFMAERAR